MRAALAAVCIFSPTYALGAELSICEREMVRAAAVNDVPLGMLYAIGLTESGRDGSLQPYALNIEGRAVYEASKAEAVRSFEDAQRGGAKLIDVGCMQINHHFHARHFGSLEDMLDPAQNVAYAARFLSELKKREGSWTMAIARYHAGPDNV
jgi:soluble lytic murein transglycosylase-like protein